MKRILLTLLFVGSLQCVKAQTEDYYGPVTISFHGFICNRPTNDDALGRDGVGDEVSVHFWNWMSVATNRANYNGLLKIYGEDFFLHDRIKAGTATINGGLKAGDSYYREGVYGDNDPNILSNYAIINTFCSQNTLIVMLPTIWERDEGTFGVTPIQDFGVAANNAFNDMTIKQRFRDFSNYYTYSDTDPYGYFLQGWTIGLDAKFSGLFTANKNKLASRPIGLYPTWDFSSQVLVLTPKTIKIIAEKDYGYGKGIIPVSYNEENLGNAVGHGNYIILLRVVADIKLREPPPPPQPAKQYSIGVEVNSVAAGERFEFSIDGINRVTVTREKTPFYFPIKLSAGQQFRVIQLSGPRTCRIVPANIMAADSGIIIKAECGLPPAENKVGVTYGSQMMSVHDKFEFQINGGEKIVITSPGTVYFTQKFSTGQAYKVIQVSGTRTCTMLESEGVISNHDVLVNADCGIPQMSLIRMNITGIEAGESFKFADKYGRTLTTPFSTTANLGGFPVGDPLIINQIAGPRQCVITPASGVVPNSPLTIQCNCRKKPAIYPPPAEKYDLVTRSSDNKITNSYYESWAPVIGGKDEDEGRYVAFGMYGKGIDGSSGNNRQIFWRDRKTGITQLVSKKSTGEEGNGNSSAPAISDDGRYVVFETSATNLTSGDKNGYLRDVILWDQQTGQLTLVSKSAAGQTGNGESYEPVISGDGNTIVYTSAASDMVPLEPVFNTPNIYVYDISSGRTAFITKDYETGKAGSGYSPSVSEDGSKIAFCAYTYRLVKNDNNNLWDVFLWQKGVPGLKRISMTAAGGERNQGDESSSRVVWPSISGDGNNIVFATTSANIVTGDTNRLQDIFLYNIPTGSIKRVSTLNGLTEGDGDSPAGQGERIGISYDGTWITYNTNATNMGVPKGNIVKQNTGTGEIIPVTKITAGSTARPMISREGNFVIAGCSEHYDKRYSSSGIFVIYTGH